jgi:hypothetical protein
LTLLNLFIIVQNDNTKTEEEQSSGKPTEHDAPKPAPKSEQHETPKPTVAPPKKPAPPAPSKYYCETENVLERTFSSKTSRKYD